MKGKEQGESFKPIKWVLFFIQKSWQRNWFRARVEMWRKWKFSREHYIEQRRKDKSLCPQMNVSDCRVQNAKSSFDDLSGRDSDEELEPCISWSHLIRGHILLGRAIHHIYNSWTYMFWNNFITVRYLRGTCSPGSNREGDYVSHQAVKFVREKGTRCPHIQCGSVWNFDKSAPTKIF